LTAATVADAVLTASKDVQQVLVCGGGLHNRDLMRRLAAKLPDIRFESTAAAGLDPDWVEAAAFAWLAMRRTQGLTGNLPSVTGASGPAVLGAVHSAG
jgi:anhydro-N-acetylmuramic acid kinase